MPCIFIYRFVFACSVVLVCFRCSYEPPISARLVRVGRYLVRVGRLLVVHGTKCSVTLISNVTSSLIVIA